MLYIDQLYFHSSWGNKISHKNNLEKERFVLILSLRALFVLAGRAFCEMKGSVLVFNSAQLQSGSSLGKGMITFKGCLLVPFQCHRHQEICHCLWGVGLCGLCTLVYRHVEAITRQIANVFLCSYPSYCCETWPLNEPKAHSFGQAGCRIHLCVFSSATGTGMFIYAYFSHECW